MESFVDLDISERAVLQTLVAGVLLYFLFRLLSRILNIIPEHRLRPALTRLLSAIEGIGWIFFLFWAVGKLFTEPLYNTIATLFLLAIVGVWIAWYAVRDWIAGVLLKVQDVYESDQFIQLDDMQGRVTRLGYLSMEIEQENGDRVKIPYSKISGQIHSIHHPEVLSNYYRFQVSVPQTSSAVDASNALRTAILNTPWSSPQKPIRINLVQESENMYVFEAMVYATRQSFAQAIEDAVRQEFPDMV